MIDAIRSRKVVGESVNTGSRGGDEEEAGEEAGLWGSGGARQGAFGAANRQVSERECSEAEQFCRCRVGRRKGFPGIDGRSTTSSMQLC